MTTDINEWLKTNKIKKCPPADKRFNPNDCPYREFQARMSGRPSSERKKNGLVRSSSRDISGLGKEFRMLKYHETFEGEK